MALYASVEVNKTSMKEEITFGIRCTSYQQRGVGVGVAVCGSAIVELLLGRTAVDGEATVLGSGTRLHSYVSTLASNKAAGMWRIVWWAHEGGIGYPRSCRSFAGG